MLCEECCIGRSNAFLLGAGSIFSGFSDEQSQLSTALVEKEVLPCRDVVFANCALGYQVSGNWMSDYRLRLPHDLLFNLLMMTVLALWPTLITLCKSLFEWLNELPSCC